MADKIDNQESVQEAVVEQADPQDRPMTAKEFNMAQSARERAFEKRLQKQQEEFQNVLKGYVQPPKEEPALSRTAELEKQIKDMSKALQERDTREKDTNLRKRSEQALKQHGIDADFTDHALAYLVDAKKAIRYDSSGNIIMVVDGLEYDDLDEGMKIWSQSRDAKLYKRPTGAQGSGDAGRRNNAQSIEQMNKAGSLELKNREGAAKSFNPQDPKLSLDRSSRINLQQLLAQKLAKQ